MSARPGALDWSRDGPDWPNHALSRFVEAGALTWHVQETAAPPGAPSALLLHGTGGASANWRLVLRLLGTEWHLVAPDLPGHAFTRTPPLHPLGLPAMVADLGRLLAALRFAPDLVVGHSAGGAIGLALALAGLVRPRGLLLVNPALESFRGLAGLVFPAMARMIWVAPFSAAMIARYARSPGTVERLLEGTGSRIDEEGRRVYRRLFESADHAAGAFGMMAQWTLAGLARDLPRVDRPVTILLGLRDRFVPPATTRAIARTIPGARIVEDPGAGHLLHEEDPARVGAEMAALLAAAPPP